VSQGPGIVRSATQGAALNNQLIKTVPGTHWGHINLFPSALETPSSAFRFLWFLTFTTWPPAPGKRRVLVARSKGFVFLTEDELLLILRTAKTKSIRDWAMILTTYSHGLRAAETCRLKLTDLDMRGSVLSIHRLKGSLFTIQELERHRGIPLLDEVKSLKEWLAVRPTDCGDALFTSQKGNHLTPTQFYRVFRQVAREAGLPGHKGHPHVLKHTPPRTWCAET